MSAEFENKMIDFKKNVENKINDISEKVNDWCDERCEVIYAVEMLVGAIGLCLGVAFGIIAIVKKLKK